MRYSVTLKDTYKDYKKKVKKPLPFNQYIPAMRKVTEVAIKDFLLKGYKLYVPFLGYFGILKYKPRKGT